MIFLEKYNIIYIEKISEEKLICIIDCGLTLILILIIAIKNNYCKKHNIILKRIKYNEDITLEKIML